MCTYEYFDGMTRSDWMSRLTVALVITTNKQYIVRMVYVFYD